MVYDVDSWLIKNFNTARYMYEHADEYAEDKREMFLLGMLHDIGAILCSETDTTNYGAALLRECGYDAKFVKAIETFSTEEPSNNQGVLLKEARSQAGSDFYNKLSDFSDKVKVGNIALWLKYYFKLAQKMEKVCIKYDIPYNVGFLIGYTAGMCKLFEDTKDSAMESGLLLKQVGFMQSIWEPVMHHKLKPQDIVGDDLYNLSAEYTALVEADNTINHRGENCTLMAKLDRVTEKYGVHADETKTVREIIRYLITNKGIAGM